MKNPNEINGLEQATEAVAAEAANVITLLGEGKHTCATIAAKLDEVINKINDLATQPQPMAKGKGVRDYGPASTRKMTDLDAWRIMHGDLRTTAVKDIANEQGLSRNQVYSVRGGYTFTKVHEESFDMIDVVAHDTGRTREDVEKAIDEENAKKAKAKKSSKK